MFLLNSRPDNVRCVLPNGRKAFSLSYGRFFAEFLSKSSLDHLGILYPPTCVGLRYGLIFRTKRSFSRKLDSPHFS